MVVLLPNELENCQQPLPATEAGGQNAHKEVKEVTTLYETSIIHAPPAPAMEESRCQLPGSNAEERDEYPLKKEPGQNTQTYERDGKILGKGPVATGFIDVTITATSERIARREQEISERFNPHPTKTPTDQSGYEGTSITAAQGNREYLAANSEETEWEKDTEHEISQSEPPLSKNKAVRIDKRRRVNGQGRRGTACFTGNTLILAIKSSRPQWIPIWTAVEGDTVIQSLPSGKSDDLSMALMMTMRTVCIFDFPEAKINLLQVGEAYITTRHHIHTDNGWMTARQAAKCGPRKLWIDQACDRVYSLSLNHDGNTTANLQHSPTHLVPATMGCCFEPLLDSQPKGLLTYPNSYLAKLEQIGGMETGWKHFGPNEVSIKLSGEQCLRNNRDREEAWPLTQEERQQKDNPCPTFSLSKYQTDTQQQINFLGSASLLRATPYPSNGDQTAAELMPMMKDAKLMWESAGPVTPEPTDNQYVIKREILEKIEPISQEPHVDIQLRTPNSKKVPWEEVKWVRNPYSLACQDCTGLVGGGARTLQPPGHPYSGIPMRPNADEPTLTVLQICPHNNN